MVRLAVMMPSSAEGNMLKFWSMNRYMSLACNSIKKETPA